MKPWTEEWVERAEEDWAAVNLLSSSAPLDLAGIVCFHAQQCVEKYLKGRLAEAGTGFGKTHDLVFLLDLALPLEPGWAAFRSDLARLSTAAVAYRYPGPAATATDLTAAAAACRAFRNAARLALGL
ncbi:MAG: HEPN domain-containing protein [Fimbriimonadaceae bacterium]|nr:HEPN domain-containing protein [Fimbriimonadaceae bacterium]